MLSLPSLKDFTSHPSSMRPATKLSSRKKSNLAFLFVATVLLFIDMILQDQVKFFCYLGLIPFIFIPMISWVSPKLAFEYYLILFFFSWSMMMANFMAGTLWGLAMKLNKSIINPVLIFSAIFTLSIFLTLSGKGFSIISLAVLFLIYEYIYYSEKKLIENIDWYKEIRFYLTFSIRICHLLMIAFIFTNQ